MEACSKVSQRQSSCNNIRVPPCLKFTGSAKISYHVTNDRCALFVTSPPPVPRSTGGNDAISVYLIGDATPPTPTPAPVTPTTEVSLVCVCVFFCLRSGLGFDWPVTSPARFGLLLVKAPVVHVNVPHTTRRRRASIFFCNNGGDGQRGKTDVAFVFSNRVLC